jgi:hypothetical protein
MLCIICQRREAEPTNPNPGGMAGLCQDCRLQEAELFADISDRIEYQPAPDEYWEDRLADENF